MFKLEGPLGLFAETLYYRLRNWNPKGQLLSPKARQQSIAGKPVSLYLQARALFTLAFMRFGNSLGLGKRYRTRVRTPDGLSVNLSHF